MAMVKIHYSDSLESALKKSAEECLCLQKAHGESERWTSVRNTYLTIPTIILSGLAGLGAVGNKDLLPFENSSILVGLVSFVCATLQTIGSFFAFAKRSEAHRLAAIQYAKLYQLISLELSLPRSERIAADKLLDLLKEEIGRLLETTPLLPKDVILAFKKEYKDIKSISIPAILNGLEEVAVNSETYIETPVLSKPDIRIQIKKVDI